MSLVSLSSSATAVRASAQCLCQLLATHSDNNVKLIVIDQLNMLKKRHRKVLQELVGDILRALAIPNVDIRKRALSIATDLLSPQNIEIVIQKLKKELRQSQSESDAEEYRAQLAKTLHSCAVKFPFIANTVVHMLLETLCSSSKSSSSQKQQQAASRRRWSRQARVKHHHDYWENWRGTHRRMRGSSRKRTELKWLI